MAHIKNNKVDVAEITGTAFNITSKLQKWIINNPNHAILNITSISSPDINSSSVLIIVYEKGGGEIIVPKVDWDDTSQGTINIGENSYK